MAQSIPTAQVTRRRYGAGKLWAAPLGTVISTYAPAGTGNAFALGTSATNVPGSTAWLPLGITQDGMEFSWSLDTDNDESAEYYFPHKIVVTGQSAKLAVSLKTVNLTNLRLAMNAGTGAVSGGPPSATATAKLTPPLPGAEVRCQLMWASLDSDIVIVVYSALQTNDVSLSPKKGADGLNLDLEWNCELPAAAVATTPYDINVIGASWIETVTGD